MRLIVLLRRATGAVSLNLSGHWASAVALLLVGALLAAAFTGGFVAGEHTAVNAPGHTSQAASTTQQQAELAEIRARVQERVDMLAARVGQLNAHVVRLDALGKRLADMADIDSQEFDFSATPASGGPESEGGVPVQSAELGGLLDQFESRLAQRESQLGVLEQLILQRELRLQTVPDGRPVRRGFLTSGFGMRQDPLSGELSFHRGVDFAGNRGDTVIAVGAGVVTFAAYKEGYGYMVDVTHGDGYVTRYAHNARLLVKVGDTVARGQALATMGSSGRSTGPHVHFEVLRNGLPVNPLSYIGG